MGSGTQGQISPGVRTPGGAKPQLGEAEFLEDKGG